MQTITMHIRAASVKGTLVDEWNQPLPALPALTRGLRAELALKLVDANGDPLPAEALAFPVWDFVVADDWDTSTPPQLRVSEGIAVSGNEVRVPLTETNTEELVEALGTSESAVFGCELAGFEAGSTDPAFLLQFDILVRNRRGDAGTGTPAPVGDGAYSAAQIRALFAARMAIQVSVDGNVWEDVLPGEKVESSANWYRLRNELVGGEWSLPMPYIHGRAGTVEVDGVDVVDSDAEAGVRNLGTPEEARLRFSLPRGPRGESAEVRVGETRTGEPGSDAAVENAGTPQEPVLEFTLPRGQAGERGEAGEKGDSAYVYVAYASRADGRGFSLVPSASLKYRAELHTAEPVENPTLSDFSGCAWVKYIGDDAVSYGEVQVAGLDAAVSGVSRLVFENARVRRGDDGEAIVNFDGAGAADGGINRHALLNGRTRLSPWTSGGGSQSADPGLQVCRMDALPDLPGFPAYSSFSPATY